VTDGSIKQEQGPRGPECLQETKNKLQSLRTCLRQAVVGRLPSQITYNAVVGSQNRTSEKGALHRYLNIVPVHHQPFSLPCHSSAPLGKTPQGIFLAEYTPMEQLPFQMRQSIAVAHPLKCRPPRITAILEEEKVQGCLVQLTAQEEVLRLLGSDHEDEGDISLFIGIERSVFSNGAFYCFLAELLSQDFTHHGLR